MKRIVKVQNLLKVGKEQRNNFGNYNYRSAEDILGLVKPLLLEEDLILFLSDSVKLIGDRFYIEAKASIYEESGNLLHSVTALAREALTQKGMSDSQITGSASSYARKYALQGLFLLADDKDDPDSQDHRPQQKQRQQQRPQQQQQRRPQQQQQRIIATGEDKDNFKTLCFFNELTEDEVIRYGKLNNKTADETILGFLKMPDDAIKAFMNWKEKQK